MSEIMVSMMVSDRKEKDHAYGLHALVELRERLSEKVFTIEGNAVLSDEVTIQRIEIIRNELNLKDEVAVQILEAAFDTCWNAVVIENNAAAGLTWRPLISWLAGHVDVVRLPSLSHLINIGFQQIS